MKINKRKPTIKKESWLISDTVTLYQFKKYSTTEAGIVTYKKNGKKYLYIRTTAGGENPIISGDYILYDNPNFYNIKVKNYLKKHITEFKEVLKWIQLKEKLIKYNYWRD